MVVTYAKCVGWGDDSTCNRNLNFKSGLHSQNIQCYKFTLFLFFVLIMFLLARLNFLLKASILFF